MTDLIHQLTLGAGLNNEKKICSYLEISRSTWYRRLTAGRLRRVENEALRHRAGYLLHGAFQGFRIVEDRIYSRTGESATATEIEHMDFMRRYVHLNYQEVEQKAREYIVERGTEWLREF